jgi:uncharacterized membrane protein YraQ (UPF0718 family)
VTAAILDPTGLVYVVVMLVVYAYVARTRPGVAGKAAKAGAKQLGAIAPTFVAVFGLVGLFRVFVPPELIQRWMGDSAGALSLLVGAGVGSLAAGPPPTAFPIAAGLLESGAWMPAVAAFIVSWVLVGVASLPFEATLFGWRFALLRNGASFLAAMAVGLVMGWVL